MSHSFLLYRLAVHLKCGNDILQEKVAEEVLVSGAAAAAAAAEGLRRRHFTRLQGEFADPAC